MDVAFISSAGGRSQNQDYLDYKTHNDGVYCVLADGLGGHNGGERASKIAVENLLQATPTNLDDFTELFESAHQAIHKSQDENNALAQMASAAVALSIHKSQVLWGHVGDTRIYWIRDGKIIHQSKDHSIPQLLLSEGEITADEIRHHPERNRLHRVLGDTHEKIHARLSKNTQTIQEGDVFLLCSDGFWEWLPEDKMLDYLLLYDSARDWLESMEEYLLSHASGRFDNYSAISIFCNNKCVDKISNTL